VRSEGLYISDISMIPAWIEPATFLIVAQHFNNFATAVAVISILYINYEPLYVLYIISF